MRKLLLLLLLLVAVPASAANLRGIIYAAPNNGPFVYTFEVDGALQNNVNTVASTSAAIDGVKALIIAQGGTILKVSFNVSTTTEQMLAQIRPTVNNGPVGYWFEVDGAMKNFVNGVANVSVAADAVKGLIGAEGGTFVKGTIIVITQ